MLAQRVEWFMSPTTTLNNLNNEAWDRLQSVLERFERDSEAKGPRSIESYLPSVQDPLRRTILEELVRVDIELRWQLREGQRVEEYIKAFPELSRSRCLPRILADEYRARLAIGERPTLDEYAARFPQFLDELRELVDSSGIETANSLCADSDCAGTDLNPQPAVRFSTPPSAPMVIVPNNNEPTQQDWEKIRRIGSGAFGDVWEARSPGSAPFAVKVIKSKISKPAQKRELGALKLFESGRLRHAFVLQVFRWWYQDGLLHIAMELADCSLKEELERVIKTGKKGFDAADVETLMREAATTLDFLNLERDIFHRDIKPANMLLMNGHLKLGDFGLSRLVEQLDLMSTIGAGTPTYMAPEIIEGKQKLGCDQYSLACTYFKLRTNRELFRGNPVQVRKQQLSSPPILTGFDLSPQEQAALERALRKRSEERFPSCREFVEALIRRAPERIVDPDNHHTMMGTPPAPEDFLATMPKLPSEPALKAPSSGTAVGSRNPTPPPGASKFAPIAGGASRSAPAAVESESRPAASDAEAKKAKDTPPSSPAIPRSAGPLPSGQAAKPVPLASTPGPVQSPSPEPSPSKQAAPALPIHATSAATRLFVDAAPEPPKSLRPEQGAIPSDGPAKSKSPTWKRIKDNRSSDSFVPPVGATGVRRKLDKHRNEGRSMGVADYVTIVLISCGVSLLLLLASSWLRQ